MKFHLLILACNLDILGSIFYTKAKLYFTRTLPRSVFPELKLRLDWLLEYKLSHPGNVSWNVETADIKLLK